MEELNISSYIDEEDLHAGFACVTTNREIFAFSHTEILAEGCETIYVTCVDEIDMDKMPGYILNDDNTITWNEEKWKTYVHDVVEPNNIRSRREEECFCYINRGDIWYSLYVNTPEREEEFKVWYQAWLNAPETRVIPAKPAWII